MSITTALIIPTRNSKPFVASLQKALEQQSLRLDEILIVDSSSIDGSAELWKKWGARVETVDPRTFNHGGTRGWASRMVKADVLIYMTQDAIPDDSETMLQIRDALYVESDVGTAFGRQLPHTQAGVLARQSRAFNYPPESMTKRMADAPRLGIKTCFSSDAFAAYRHDVLDEVGGFPEDVIGTEDAHVAARMLLAGYAVRYAAEARVRHSHDYTVMQEFRRYFDIGVFYGRETWIREHFGTAGGDGRRYVRAEAQALLDAGKWWLIPEMAVRTVLKLAGYRLGHMEKRLSTATKRSISMFPGYWK